MLSVIIPTCHRNDLLALCLNKLAPGNQSLPFNNYEVIVSDDGIESTAEAMIMDDYPWVKWIEGPKKGPAANRNNGANCSCGEWLVFTDDDCLPEKEWLKSYQKQIYSNHYLYVLEGRTIADRPQNRFDEQAPLNLVGNKLWSCNFAIKRDLFLKLNGFDDSFPFAAMEDVDFYTRVLKHTSTHFVPEAIVIHPWRKAKPFDTFNKHLKSHVYFARKYKSTSSLSFRWTRSKIFIHILFSDFRELFKFRMKGWRYYIEKCCLNFCLIFI
ncbi:glycosyltransferase family 2 protein [Pleomorphovibrio marinus]|uniref:glycosyltransferase family 2 protein n=1 Tax=Pleomorphovibrio marinus TaxID=2164132 RepID=UPI000E0C6130|nr:glycosyltransferase family A protein [Pleomorphovibrio marinus]